MLALMVLFSACSYLGDGGSSVGEHGNISNSGAVGNINSVTDEALLADATTAHEHRFGVIPGYDSTCDKVGKTEGYGCLDCGYMVIHQGDISKKEHEYVHTPSVPATCTSEGSQGGRHCSVCGYVISKPTVIPKLSHKVVNDPLVPADCVNEGKTAGSHCSVCNEVIKAQEPIPRDETKHNYVYTPEVNPTGRRAGKTAGISCATCKAIVLESKEIPALGHEDHRAYEGKFGYFFLGELPDGEKLQALYDNIDETAIRFHNDTSRDIESNKVVAILDYSSLGLTSSQAITVWTVYRADHPLYYWISNAIGYSDFQLTIYTTEEFLLGSERERYNKAIYDGILEISEKIPLDANEYEIATILHDHIVLGMDYAYMENGEPEEAIWAHSVIGFFDKSAGVCETYAKVYQLMLNYFEVDNIYVTGDAGDVKHAWNLLQMDDGYWYWFDLTWDDSPKSAQGFNRNYFCVTDDQPIGISTFVLSHTHTPSAEYGINFSYTLPERSKYKYVREEDRETGLIRPISSYQWKVSGEAIIADVERVIHADITDEKIENVSISEFVIPLVEKFPSMIGYQVSAYDVYIVVDSMIGDKVEYVTITKKVSG